MRPLTLEPTATVGVLANPSGECAPQLLAIEAWAGAQGLRTVDLGTTDRADDLPEGGALVIALGGDGTILRALQLAMEHHAPVLGVNFGTSVSWRTSIATTSHRRSTASPVARRRSTNAPRS